MKISKRPLAALSVLAAGALIVAATSAQASTVTVDNLMTGDQRVFAGTYVTAGANSTIDGSVLAGTYLTAGAKTKIDGSTAAGTATTLGANSKVTGSVQSGTATTLGAKSEVAGSIQSGTVTTGATGATKVTDGVTSETAQHVADGKDEILSAHGFMGKFGAGGYFPPGNITEDTTLPRDEDKADPEEARRTYVFGISGFLAVAANTTITLDAACQNTTFLFNVSSYLTFGENATVEVINNKKTGCTADVDVDVIWNVSGGYVSLGARADVVGAVLAHGYVSTGANSTLRCADGVYSATSYVTIGAGAIVTDGATVTVEDDATVTDGGCSAVPTVLPTPIVTQ